MTLVKTGQVIAESKFNKFHFMILFWCTFIIVLDGYDLAVYGAVLPVLIDEWGLSNVQAGAMGSYGLIGVMFGAFFFGPLADRIGRKNVIIACFILFSVFTGLCGFADSPTSFSTYRFIAGLGLGGIMPNVIALMTDYSPKENAQLNGFYCPDWLLYWRHARACVIHILYSQIRLGIRLLYCSSTDYFITYHYENAS